MLLSKCRRHRPSVRSSAVRSYFACRTHSYSSSSAKVTHLFAFARPSTGFERSIPRPSCIEIGELPHASTKRYYPCCLVSNSFAHRASKRAHVSFSKCTLITPPILLWQCLFPGLPILAVAEELSKLTQDLSNPQQLLSKIKTTTDIPSPDFLTDKVESDWIT